MDAYVSKPVSKDTLLSLVARSVRSGGPETDLPSGRAGNVTLEVVMDRVVIDDLRLLGEPTGDEFLADIVRQFVTDTELFLIELTSAIEIDDAPVVARIAHSIKGSSDQLGGRRLALACSRLERLATANLLLDSKMIVREIDVEYQDLCRALTRAVSAPAREETRASRHDVIAMTPTQSDMADSPTAEYPTETISDRVLLVEDNPVNQRVAIAMLETLGFCTDVVDNGVEAVITATVVPYRAILMDCQIPVLNGYEVTKEIRSQWGASRCSPIIAVTSANSVADRQRSLDAGMDGHLAKPLSLETLAAGMALWAPDRPSPDSDTSSGVSDPGADDDRPTPVGGSSRPTLDADVVGRLERLGAAGGEDLLGQLVTLFMDDADTRMVALHEALAREDGPALIHLAHTMCGASANLGAAELARLCARLATDGAVSDLESNGAFLGAIEAELGRVRMALGAGSPSAIPSVP